jgi:dihydrofolate synthase/folylpolyglutamate synthase
VSVLSRIGDARATLPPIDPEDGYLSPVGSFLMGGLDFLARAGCDVIVAEAGIGGASDELSLFALDTVVVTGVFGEHLDLLGPTVIDVARNKSAVITEATRSVFTLPQPAEIRDVIVARCESVAAELTVVGDAPIDRELFPPGFSGINARLGTTAGSSLAEAIVGEPPEDEALRATVRSVSYPGRLSVHPFGSGRVVVDSAVSRDGLVSALAFAAEALDGPPPQILVSLPREKDLGGFIEELRDVAARRVFVGLTTHLQYPDRDEWPWEWADVRDLPALLASGDTLAIGTVSFSAEVLRVLGVNADVLFASPDRPGRKPLP